MIRSILGRPADIFALLAVMTSVPFAGPASASSLAGLGLFAASLAAYLWLVTGHAPLPVRMVLAAVLAMGPNLVEFLRAPWWSLSFDNLFVSLFGAHGLLYGAPLLWAGFVGLISLRYENPGLLRLALAALVPGTLGLLLSTDELTATNRAATWIPFLLPGMAQCFEKARAFATRRPERVLAGAGGLLVLWNLLFMEQYRLRLLPSDDTVSFAQVTSNSAGLLSRAVGTPSRGRRTGSSRGGSMPHPIGGTPSRAGGFSRINGARSRRLSSATALPPSRRTCRCSSRASGTGVHVNRAGAATSTGRGACSCLCRKRAAEI